MEKTPVYDIFLSYQREDEEWTKYLASRIELEKYGERNLRCFFAPWDIQAGDNIIARIDNALAEARFVAIVVSPEALQADWPTAERAAAIYSDPSGRIGRVIPLLRRRCKIPPLLAFRNYIDFTSDSKFEPGYKRLVYILKGEPLPRGQNILQRTQALPSLNQTSPLLINREAVVPDSVIEELHSNLFPIKSIPTKIWSAPTLLDEYGIRHYFGKGRFIPPHITHSDRLFTFADLSSKRHPFSGIIEEYDLKHEDTDEWYNDPDKSKLLTYLLNDGIRAHCYSMGLQHDKKGKKYFFPQGVLKSEKISWTAHIKKSARNLIREKKNQVGVTLYFIHRAIDLRFLILGVYAFLRLEPGLVFTLDGRVLIEGRRRAVLSTKYLSRQKNSPDFDEMRFWAWLLSEDGKTIRFDYGGEKLDVSTMPLSTQISAGIFGDFKKLPETIEEPPDLLEEGGPEESDGDLEGDEIEEEIEDKDAGERDE